MVSSTAFRPHQNPQKPAPSGQSKRRDRPSETRPRNSTYVTLFNSDFFLCTDCFLIKYIFINAVTVLTHGFNSHVIHASLLWTFIFYTPTSSSLLRFTTHERTQQFAEKDVKVMCPSRYAALLGGFLND